MDEKEPMSISNMPTRYLGFDSGGEVFLVDGRVFRGVYPGNEKLYRDVLNICEIHNLFEYGIVPTRESFSALHSHLNYKLVFEHERIPFITYPHEWSASMLKDATLFHIELYAHLAPYRLTVKDWHPYNILFKGSKPIFVDFASIVPIERLFSEAYLTSHHVPVLLRHVWDKASIYIYEMYRRMYIPYFLLPLYLMYVEKHAYARRRMLETAMNASRDVITEDEVFSNTIQDRELYRLKNIFKCGMLLQRGIAKHWFWNKLTSEISELNVKPKASGYSNYYSEKSESFTFSDNSNWGGKQYAVYNAIRQLNPRTVLDIGSNTGWFSILAARLGCQVIALDIDESCVDTLYQYAKAENLSIQTIVGNITQLAPDIAPLDYKNEPSLSLIGSSVPLLLASTKRFKCDMVLALAITHHLVLGLGMSFDHVVELLHSYTEKYLLVEFVAKEDRLIVEENAFFQSYSRNPQSFEWYTLENFIEKLSSKFRSIELHPSHPDLRTILICMK